MKQQGFQTPSDPEATRTVSALGFFPPACSGGPVQLARTKCCKNATAKAKSARWRRAEIRASSSAQKASQAVRRSAWQPCRKPCMEKSLERIQKQQLKDSAQAKHDNSHWCNLYDHTLWWSCRMLITCTYACTACCKDCSGSYNVKESKTPVYQFLHRVQVMDFRSILPLQKRRRTFDDRKHIYTKGAFFGCIAYMQAHAINIIT